MTRISKRKFDKEIERRCFQLFWQLVVDLKTEKEAEEFFQSLFSFTEHVMMIKRLAIAIALTKEYTYQQIYETFKVSHPTILSVQKQMLISPGYQNAVKKLLSRQQNEKLGDIIEEIFLKLSLPAAYKSPRFEKKSQAGKELFRRKRQRSIL